MGNGMSDHHGFLAAICENPDSDTYRLVYADFLQESTDPLNHDHADFIRSQLCERNRIDEDNELRRLRQANCELLTMYRDRWLVPLKDRAERRIEQLEPISFQRGFVESIAITIPLFLEHAATLLSLCPIREVEFYHHHANIADVAALAQCPALRRLRGIRFRPAAFHQAGLGDEGLRLLLTSPHLSNLRCLSLERQRLTNVGLQHLAECESLGNLERLQIGYNRPSHNHDELIDAGGLIALAKSPHLRQLRTLDLSHLDLGVEGMESLAESAVLQIVTELNLQRCELGTHGIVTLAHSPYLRELLRLDLRNNRIGVRGAMALADSYLGHKLRSLDLSSNRVMDGGITCLAHSGTMLELRSLSVRRNRLTDQSAVELAGSTNFRHLLSLDLRHNHIRLSGAKSLAASTGFPALENFDLRGNTIPQQQRAKVRKLFVKGNGRI